MISKAACVGKMKQIPPSGWSYLAHSGLPVTHAPLFTVNPCNKSFIGLACLVKMALCWPHFWAYCKTWSGLDWIGFVKHGLDL